MDAPMNAALTKTDIEHLRLLAIFHYVLGGMTVLCGFFPIIHLSMGIAMVTGEMGQPPPPPFMGWMFVIVATFMMLLFWLTAGLMIVAGGNLKRRRKRMFCLVTAALGMIVLQPLGLALGIFTVIVLSRDAVRAAFEEPAAPTEF
jgi:protein-S-isoprenylcysteine O-methyltransferase Ste14